MASVGFVTRAIDEAGNAVGGSGTEVRVYDDFACTTASTVTDSGGTTIAQPITPNAGTQTTLVVTTAAGDTTITVAATTGFAVGQLIPIYNGTSTIYRFIRSILSSPARLTLDAAVGAVFSNTNTTIGNADMLGVVGGYVVDSSYHYIQTKDVASTRLMPPTLIPTMIAQQSTAVQDEGVAVNNRSTLNIKGPGIAATDDVPNTRINITLTPSGFNQSGTFAGRPAAGTDGLLYWATDTALLYRDNGSSWDQVTKGLDLQTFTSNGTWTKPTNAKIVEVIVIGGGGSGGGPSSGGNASGGGGGGAAIRYVFPATALGATETVTVGAAGLAQSTANTAGNAGGTSSLGAHALAYGGAGGASASAANGSGGGGGGGGSAGSGATGGSPHANVANSAATGGGGGDGGGLNTAGYAAEYGGAGGGGGAAGAGGSATRGGAGGGGGNAAGGVSGSTTAGGGGAAGNPGAAGTSRSATGKAGDGGGGGSTAGANGGAGGVPGGGGGGLNGAGPSTSGAGGRGEVIVITYF